MNELSHAELIAIIKSLARVVLLHQAEIEVLGIAQTTQGIVLPAERLNALVDIQPLLDLLDAGKLSEFLRAFERKFPTP